MIQDLLYIVVVSRTVAASIVSLSWVQDGVNDVEAGAFRWMKNIGSAKVKTSVVSLSWVEGGIDEIEVMAIEEISYIDYADTEVASSVVSLDWVEDGIKDAEVDLIEALASIANKDAGEALRIVYVVKTSGTKGEPLKRATWTLTGSGSSQICQPPFG